MPKTNFDEQIFGPTLCAFKEHTVCTYASYGIKWVASYATLQLSMGSLHSTCEVVAFCNNGLIWNFARDLAFAKDLANLWAFYWTVKIFEQLMSLKQLDMKD